VNEQTAKLLQKVNERLRDAPAQTRYFFQAAERVNRKNLEILTMLAARWPRAFALLEADRRPLKLGIRDDITAVLGADAPPRLPQILAWYCNAIGYLRRCLPGATRRDLDGESAGEVTADEAANARYKLDQRTAKRIHRAKSAAANPTVQSAIKSSSKAAPKPAAPPSSSTAQPTGSQPRLGLAGLREAARRRAAGG
jgi:ProP effector